MVSNAFMEFIDLLFSVGRIKDRIKRGKIVDIRARTLGKRRNILEEHVRGRAKENLKQ